MTHCPSGALCALACPPASVTTMATMSEISTCCSILSLLILLPLQPQRCNTTAIVEALVGGIVLHIRVPGGGKHTGVRVHVVLLLGLIALKRKNDLPACLQVFGAPLFLEHGRD